MGIYVRPVKNSSHLICLITRSKLSDVSNFDTHSSILYSEELIPRRAKVITNLFITSDMKLHCCALLFSV